MTQSNIIQALERVREALIGAASLMEEARPLFQDGPHPDKFHEEDDVQQAINDFPALLEAVKELQAKLDAAAELRQTLYAKLGAALAEPNAAEIASILNGMEILSNAKAKLVEAALTNFIKGRRL